MDIKQENSQTNRSSKANGAKLSIIFTLIFSIFVALLVVALNSQNNTNDSPATPPQQEQIQ